MNACINTHRGKVKLKNFRILLDGVFCFNIVRRIIITKLKTKEDAVIIRHMQEHNLTTNLKVKIDSTLTSFRATKIVMWECHVDSPLKVDII